MLKAKYVWNCDAYTCHDIPIKKKKEIVCKIEIYE